MHIAPIIAGCLLTAVIALTTGCVAVVGTPDGIKAYADGQAGLVVTGKARPNETDTYFQHRSLVESQPGFLAGLFGKRS